MSDRAQRALVALSEWIDAENDHRDPEAVTWGRVAKVSEEGGEVIAAMVGWTGQNPRKGHTHTVDDVVDELLDNAVTALGAVEHLKGHGGDSLWMLDEKILQVAARAGVVTESVLDFVPHPVTDEGIEWVPLPDDLAARITAGIVTGITIGKRE